LRQSEPGAREFFLGLVVVEAAGVDDLVGSWYVTGLAGGGEELIKPTLIIHSCTPFALRELRHVKEV
jgi:hypothetical protein